MSKNLDGKENIVKRLKLTRPFIKYFDANIEANLLFGRSSAQLDIEIRSKVTETTKNS